MKRITIISLFAVFGLTASLTSCQKENGTDQSKESGNIVFTACIDNGTMTKTILQGSGDPVQYYVKWEKSDKISINGAVFGAMPRPSDASTATFYQESGSAPTVPYHAYYPSTLYNGSTAILPATQTYVPGKFNAPMYAESNDLSLTFKNICAVLALTVKSSDMAVIKKIRVSSTNCALSGAFTLVNNVAVLSNPGATDNNVILDCGTGVNTTADGTVFYIAIPAQTYNKLLIELSSDGTTFENRMRTKDDEQNTLAANTLYSINFETHYIDEYDINQGKGITANGMTWAPVNCGYHATDFKYGKLYQFGRAVGCGYKRSGADPRPKPSLLEEDTYLIQEYTSDPDTTSNPDDDKFYAGTSYSPGYWYTSELTKWPACSSDTGYLVGKIDDPCPVGWRVPTEHELGNMMYSDYYVYSIPVYSVSPSSPSPLPDPYPYPYETQKTKLTHRGSWDADNYGWDLGNGIFLPAAGYRSYYNITNNRGYYGMYWSSHISMCLRIDNEGVTRLQNYITGQATGLSVRCIKK